MSNIAKVYSQITGRQERHNNRNEDVPPNAQLPEQQLPELSGQNKIDWLSHPRTQQMFEELGAMIRKYEQQSSEIANNTFKAVDANYRLMEQHLVRAETLRNVILTYSKH
jgi:hypothetical protein